LLFLPAPLGRALENDSGSIDLKNVLMKVSSQACSKLRQILFEICSQIREITSTAELEDESTGSRKVFYIISLILLIYIIFLSPDKIPQMVTQTSAGIVEKAQEIIKKLIPI
jgi:hypothetical protein